MTSRKISLAKAASAQITENKSVFIANASPVASEEEAREFINQIKNKYAGANHNVWAYLLKGGAVARVSDDGEPKGTAGLPVLEILRKSGIDDSVIVVTRYFGGILLGAGGLVRAYSSAAKAAVDAAGIAEWVVFIIFNLFINYSDYQKLNYELPKLGVAIESAEFAEEIKLTLAVEKANYLGAIDIIAKITNARAKAIPVGEEMRAVENLK